MTIRASKYQVQDASHEPFPIADYEQALVLAREPWRSPAASLRRAENVRAFRGQLVKRQGVSRFAEISSSTAVNRVVKYDAVGNSVNRYSEFRTTGNVRPVISSIIFDDNSGAGPSTIYAHLVNERWDTTIGGWKWDVLANGSTTIIGFATWVATSTPKFSALVYWHRHPLFSAQSANEGYISYWTNPETPIVGAFRFATGSGDYSIVCDPDYVHLYDSTNKFYKLQGFGSTGFAGPFTGGDTDTFWFEQVDSYVVMTNNKDPVCKWDPALATADSVLEMPTDWATPTVNAMNTCLLVFQFAGRLVYFNTVEGSTRYPTRARWTDAGTATGWRSASDYTDAPRNLGAIVTGQFIGERLFIGFEKGWMEFVRRPGDVQMAFEWRPFISRFGAVSKGSTIQDSERLLSRAPTSMQTIDPNGQTYLDVPIPDLVLDFSSKYANLCSSIRSEKDRAMIWSYVSQGATTPDNLLVAVYDEKNQLSWSTYDIPANAFSTYVTPAGLTWDQLSPLTWDQLSGRTWDSLGFGAQGAPVVIFGHSKGNVYTLDGGLVDNYWDGPEAIEITIESQRLNPFQNQRAHLGYFDLLVDTQSTVTFKMSFYADEDSAPFKEETFTVTPTSGKAYHRLSVDRTALFHKFKLENSDGKAFSIDAFVPWFRPAGRVRKF